MNGGSRDSMYSNNILEAVGNTPLIKLNRMTGPEDADVFVKYEAVNIGGSVKTRTALNMIEAAERAGKLKPDSIICEPTSGNQGIGLALVGAVKGYQVIIVMPDSVSEERHMLVRQYGAKVVLIHDEGDIGKAVNDCLEYALKLAESNPKVFVPQQFENPDNPAVHYEKTAREIIEQMGELTIDGFCSGYGSGGTITGIGRALREHNPKVHIAVLEVENAPALLGGPIGTHFQQGIGDGFVPANFDTGIYDEVMIVSDEQALSTARRLAREEGMLTGISAGTNVWGALQLAKKLGRGKNVVCLAPDTGERYCSTILFDTSGKGEAGDEGI